MDLKRSLLSLLIFFSPMIYMSVAGGAEKVSLQLRWDHQFQFAGYYAAKWNGYYDDAGLDVEIRSAVTPQGILSAVEEVGAGRADFGIGGADILMGIDQGTPLVVVASIFQHSAAAFFTRPDTVIKHPSDFLDLKVARRVNDLIDIELQVVLKAEGVDPHKVQPFPHGPGMDHLLSGEVDVIPGYSINIPFTASLLGVQVNEIHPIKYGIHFYGDSLFTRRDLVERDPDLVSRFKQASIEGWIYALEHPDAMVQKIVLEYPHRSIPDNQTEFNRFQSRGVAELIHYPEIEVGHINPHRWEKMHQQLRELGIVNQELKSGMPIFDPEKQMRLASEKKIEVIQMLLIVIIGIGVMGLAWIYFLKKMVKRRTIELAKSHQQLKTSEELFRNIFENANIGVAMVRIDGILLTVNPAFCRTLGYTKNELIGKRVHDITHPEDLHITQHIIEQCIDQKTDINQFEKRYLHKNGATVWGEVSSSLILDDAGDPDYFITHLKDVTARKTAEKDREQLLMAMEHIAETIIVTDTQGVVQYVNSVFEEVSGYAKSEVLGRPIGLLKSGTHDTAFYRQMWETISSGETWKGEFVNRKKDGKLYTERAAISPVMDNNGRIISYVGVKHDITDILAMEEKLRQAHKMEAIGTLAGGIAHDFNNILSSIIGFTELALGDVEKGSEMEADLIEVYTAGNRAKELVKQILAFARKTEESLQPVQVSIIVKEVIKFLRASIPSSIAIEHQIRSQALIMGNATQLHQIILNLCTNAAHAMEESGGTMSISLTDIDHKASKPDDVLDMTSTSFREGFENLKSGSYVALTISDTGCGIPEDLIETIFEPYFTTKPKGEGTGMGLAVVHGIVKKYNGTVTVMSHPNEGSTFTVYLPSIKQRTAHQPLELHPAPGKNERILLVDDEKNILKVWQRLFKNLGYRVTALQSSSEALTTFKADPEGFDLVVSDVTMPEMTGDHLARELLQIRPDIPIILCTGFSKKISEEHILSIGVRALIYKPIVKSEIAIKIREILRDQSQTVSHEPHRHPPSP